MSEDKRPLVSVIILNWNGEDYIGECVDSVIDQTYPETEIIVVDNNSEDSSVEILKSKHLSHITLVENSENLGYAGGNNIGIKRSDGEYIALLNDDALADKNWISELVSRIKEGNEKTGMIASLILNYRDRKTVDNTGHLLYPDGINRGRDRGESTDDLTNYGEALFPSGCGAFYSGEMLDEIGLFDEDFFSYGDDTDLGLRARLSGWNCLYCRKAIVYHRYSKSAGAYSKKKFFYVERNRLFILLKYFPVYLIVLSFFYTLKRYFFHTLAYFRGKGSTGSYGGSFLSLTGIVLRAYLSGVLNSGEMLDKRIEYKKDLSLNFSKIYELLEEYGIGAGELAMKE